MQSRGKKKKNNQRHKSPNSELVPFTVTRWALKINGGQRDPCVQVTLPSCSRRLHREARECLATGWLSQGRGGLILHPPTPVARVPAPSWALEGVLPTGMLTLTLPPAQHHLDPAVQFPANSLFLLLMGDSPWLWGAQVLEYTSGKLRHRAIKHKMVWTHHSWLWLSPVLLLCKWCWTLARLSSLP